MIAIDTISQTLGSADENGAGMIQLIANAQALSERFGCLVLLLHHAGLKDIDRLRGHSSLGCALDALVYFERKEGATSCVMSAEVEGGGRYSRGLLHAASKTSGIPIINLLNRLAARVSGGRKDGLRGAAAPA